MYTELYKRILTSVILLPIIIVCVFYNKLFFTFFLVLAGFISVYEWYLIQKKKSNIFFYFGILFLIISFFSAYILRGDSYETIVFFLFVLFVCFFSDIGGYILGKVIGGKKLTKISPKKTISGTMGSLMFSFFPLILINNQSYIQTDIEINFTNLILSLVISIICQSGDLSISYFKRLKKIKNTSNILPGHGGLLDRIDGIIFVIPFVFFLKINGLI